MSEGFTWQGIDWREYHLGATTAPSPVFAAQTSADRLATRTLAEDKIEGVFTRLLPTEAEQALLFHLLTLRGWTRDRARIVLDKAGWSV